MQTVASLVSTVQSLMEELKISATTALDNRILGSLAIPSSTGAPVLQTTEVPYVRVAQRRFSLNDDFSAVHCPRLTCCILVDAITLNMRRTHALSYFACLASRSERHRLWASTGLRLTS